MDREPVRQQTERILASETFRQSESLRRLLRFLAEKTLSGEADSLKEYAIGVDLLGRPPDYDPRQDSIARIQAARLRQKLKEYYASEGQQDPLMIDLPKGKFRLVWTERTPKAGAGSTPADATDPQRVRADSATGSPRWKQIAVVALAAWAAIATLLYALERRAPSDMLALWNPEMEALWRAVIRSPVPQVIAISSPLFIGFQGHGLVRDLNVNRWEDVETAAMIARIRKALNHPTLLPSRNYTAIGTAAALFQLGKTLAVKDVRASVLPVSRLSWQQLADNNVILVGSFRVLEEQLNSLPIDLAFTRETGGIRNLQAPPGEPSFIADRFRSILEDYSDTPIDSGEVHAVVTSAPGPLLSTRVLAFTSNYNVGTLGAIQAFTTPSIARLIHQKLAAPSGTIPDYYQVVLKIRYKQDVPTEVHYVTHQELTPRMPRPSKR